MNAHRAKFDFASSKVPSLADVREIVRRDRSFPKSRRASTLSSLARLAKWSGQDATTIPFAEPVVEALLDQLRPDLLGISAKRLANARSDLRFVLERGLQVRQSAVEITGDAKCHIVLRPEVAPSASTLYRAERGVRTAANLRQSGPTC